MWFLRVFNIHIFFLTSLFLSSISFKTSGWLLIPTFLAHSTIMCTLGWDLNCVFSISVKGELFEAILISVMIFGDMQKSYLRFLCINIIVRNFTMSTFRLNITYIYTLYPPKQIPLFIIIIIIITSINIAFCCFLYVCLI